MNLNDPTVRRFSQLVLLAVALVMLAIACFAGYVVGEFKLSGSIGNNNQALKEWSEWLPALSGPKANDFQNIVAILVSAAPLVVAAVCFTNVGADRRLNKFGTLMLALLAAALVIAGLSFLWIDPEGWKDAHILGLEGLLHVQLWARTILSGSTFYLATLLGIKVTP